MCSILEFRLAIQLSEVYPMKRKVCAKQLRHRTILILEQSRKVKKFMEVVQ